MPRPPTCLKACNTQSSKVESTSASFSRALILNLPEACGRVFLIVAEKKIPQRDDFCIENYVNDPRTTPEDQLITEILSRRPRPIYWRQGGS